MSFFPENGKNTRWPDSTRGFPTFLITSGVFSACNNLDQPLTEDGIDVTAQKSLTLSVDSESKVFTRDYSVLDGNYTSCLSMLDFRVLLELLEVAKRSNEREVLKISPQTIFKALGWEKVGGSAYSDLEKSLERLASTHFKVTDVATGKVNIYPLIESIDTGTTYISQTGDLYSFKLEYEGSRYREYEFTVGPLLQALTNYCSLARINPNVMSRIGRSKMKQWIYCFYCCHGGNGSQILEYKCETLLETNGAIKEIDLRLKKLSETRKLTRAEVRSHRKRLIREKIYCLVKNITDIAKLNIFKRISLSESESLNQSKKPRVACGSRKLRVSRFLNSIEQAIFSDNTSTSEVI